MGDRGRGQEPVHRSEAEPASFGLRHQIAPGESGLFVDGQDSAGEAIDEVAGEPMGECVSAATGLHRRDAAADLRQRHHADEGAVLVEPVEPFENPPIGLGPPRFGEDIGIEQEPQSLKIARLVAQPLEVELGAAQGGAEQEFRQGAPLRCG